MIARIIPAMALALLAASCTGHIGDQPFAAGPRGPTSPGRPGPSDPRQGYGATGLRRLTQSELRNTLEDLFGADPGSDIGLMPADALSPFDTDYSSQLASRALVEGAKALADRAAARLVADAAARDRLVGCTPTGPADGECMRSFVARAGRRIFRRALTSDEIDRFAVLRSFSIESGDFYTGVSVVLRAMLQDPEFLYLVEIGVPTDVPGLYKLTSWEVASRLSYLVWGSTPDDDLLDLAARDALQTPEQVRGAATQLLSAARTRERVTRFHAMWLGYERPTLPAALTPSMLAETNALIERVVFDEPGSWLELFRSRETYVDDMLATHYGLAPTGSTTPRWVSYGDTGRQGILSHGTFLSVANKFDDTSPTKRGIAIRTRLFCQEIPPPPPDVNVDVPPSSPTSNCKWDRYAAHRVGGCAGCHAQTDPIGFGLENYDETGQYRTHDDGAPECVIAGEGEIVGVGTFHGPAELADLAISTGLLEPCLVKQLLRFALGRPERETDQRALEAITSRFLESGDRFDQLLLEIVSAPAFGYRIAE